MYRALYAYAWDLAEGTGDSVAETFLGLGVNTITLACAYHAGKFIRPHGAAGKVYFPEDGTVYFRARPERYGKIKPVISALSQNRDVLQELVGRDDIQANAWVVLLHNTRLGSAYPDAVVRNAFGDGYRYSLCAANPDVRAYATALCADLSDRYGVSGLSLETPGFLPFRHGFHHEFSLTPMNAWQETLLALCFCDHCKAGAGGAGIDVGGVQSRVAQAISAYLESDVAPEPDMAAAWLLADIVADGDLTAFLRWRCDQVTALIREIRDAVRDDATIAVIPSVNRPSSAAWLEGSDLEALAQTADVLEVPLYEPSPERVRTDLWDVRRRVGTAARLRAILRPGPPDASSGAQVKACVDAVRAAGVSDIAFYNYGHLRESSLHWMRDALAGEGS